MEIAPTSLFPQRPVVALLHAARIVVQRAGDPCSGFQENQGGGCVMATSGLRVAGIMGVSWKDRGVLEVDVSRCGLS